MANHWFSGASCWFRECMQPDFMDKHERYKVMHSIYTVPQNEPFKSRKGQFNRTVSYQPTQNTHCTLQNRFRLAENSGDHAIIRCLFPLLLLPLAAVGIASDVRSYQSLLGSVPLSQAWHHRWQSICIVRWVKQWTHSFKSVQQSFQ